MSHVDDLVRSSDGVDETLFTGDLQVGESLRRGDFFGETEVSLDGFVVREEVSAQDLLVGASVCEAFDETSGHSARAVDD